MNYMKSLTLLLSLCLAACGGADLGAGTSTGSVDPSIITGIEPPIIQDISPTTAARGSTVTLSGFGFSFYPEYNIVTIGTGTDSVATFATTYALAATPGTVESLTFVVPADAPLGLQNVFLVVITNGSNSDKQITITP